MSEKRRVLVTGATGQQGGAVARNLLGRDVDVRGVTRDPDSDAARALADLGAEMVRAEFADEAAIGSALDGMNAVFAMTTPFEAGVEAETAQGVALVDAAAAAGVEHFVYSSVAGADLGTGIPHFDSKHRVEQHLSASDLNWTVLGPVYFMGNLFFPDQLAGLKEGRFAIALPPDRPLQQIAVEDVGAFAGHVLTHPADFGGARVDIAGDELTPADCARVLSDVLGTEISAVEVPIEAIRAWSEDLAIMYEWFAEHGYSTDIEGLRAGYPEVGWTRFAEWAARVRDALV